MKIIYKTLIVDDSAMMRQIMKKCLHNSEYEVIGEAADGMQAIEQFKTLQPELILCDIVMPKATGLEVLNRVLEIELNTRIVMASSMGTAYAVQESLKNGAKAFIQKPFQRDQVLSVLREVV